MTATLEVWLDQEFIGHLHHDPATNRFSFVYTKEWQESKNGFPLSPSIPFPNGNSQTTEEKHSALVRQFFENLLPEGDTLDAVAQLNAISKSNLVGLMLALGKETAGAIRIQKNAPEPNRSEPDSPFREISPQELSNRIQNRLHMPFSQWDGKVRLSIAGYQDKIAVYENEGKWFLVEGSRFATTYIVKPLPQKPQLDTLPANEFFCMKLAKAVGLATAEVEIKYVPEPVLFVERFDRLDLKDHVKRIHVIDGCQALGLSVAMKYERPYGDSKDVQDIRDGVSYLKLFQLINQSANPAKDRLSLLRWALFQILIGNCDAHGKNISFFMSQKGLNLAPAYDLVCLPALKDAALSTSLAMAIGDAFSESEITKNEWILFADDCQMQPKALANQLIHLIQKILKALPGIAAISRENAISEKVIQTITSTITDICNRQNKIALEIKIDA